jgi:hypothetical protein
MDISWPDAFVYSVIIIAFFTFMIVLVKHEPRSRAPKERSAPVMPVWTTETTTTYAPAEKKSEEDASE